MRLLNINKRFIRTNKPILPINKGSSTNNDGNVQEENIGSSGSGTGHTHPNLSFLNSLNVNKESQITRDNAVVNPPLLEENW